MAPKFDVGAEINRMTAKSEMYFSIIQETYDISLQITTNTASKLKFLEKLHLIENAREQCIKLSDEINKLRYLEDPSFVPEYADMRALEILYGKIKHIEKMLDNQNISNSPIPDSVPNHHLPSIEVPKFSGNIQQWPLFYETFRALIHENTRLDNLAHNVTILPTAVTKVFTENENILLRTIIDSASARNFVTLTWCLKAQLPIKPVSAKAMGLVNSYQLSVCAYVVHKIVGKQPQTTIPVSSIQTFLKYPLADPNFYSPQEVDGILGCDVFSEIIGTHQVKNDQGAPTALETQLGYIIIGSVPNLSQPSSTSTNLCNISNPDLNVQMDKFFQLEDIPQAALPYDDDYCENHFIATTKRSPEGRYIVALPFKIINDYLTQNHLSFVAPCSLKNKVNDSSHIENAYYIPHFAVEKESSSTPLRVVFDASAKNAEFTSLNENLHVGPKLQTNICSILLNFRMGRIALMADIKQMYRNIWVREQDRKYQRILWRPSPDVPIGIYELNTVTFGLSSSPFQAIRTIKQLSRDERSKFSESLIKILENDIYIDDVVTSVDSLENTKIIVRDRQIVFASGGFEFKKMGI
ncbi:uncharacterized protein LOC113380636 [Ctenocephalides felis]|uniref:uncharacterized protein LOC113380636 n=1 Tax=Ctenocephalides felis TaxID=7515 RepID=UPI000E6E32C2|nr:uncharacterized protein LOC113380636 [Ctenocephalides felis]